jgi:hypothetical protein
MIKGIVRSFRAFGNNLQQKILLFGRGMIKPGGNKNSGTNQQSTGKGNGIYTNTGREAYAQEKKMNIISWLSFTAVLKRIIDIAPTSPNALARLLPMTIITRAVIMVSMIIALVKVEE